MATYILTAAVRDNFGDRHYIDSHQTHKYAGTLSVPSGYFASREDALSQSVAFLAGVNNGNFVFDTYVYADGTTRPIDVAYVESIESRRIG